MLLSSKRLNSIIISLSKEEYLSKGWGILLKEVSAVFGAKSAFLSFIDEDNNIIKCLNENNEFTITQKNKIAKDVLRKKQSIAVENYPLSKYSSKYWVERGVKSVMAAPIYFEDKIYAVLEVVYHRNKKLTSEELETLETLTLLLGTFLYSNKIHNHFKNILDINNKMFNLLYAIDIPASYKSEEFIEWLKKIFRTLSYISGCIAIGVVYPDENVYGTYYNFKGEDNFYIKYNEDEVIRDLIAYKICRNNIKKPLMDEDVAKEGITLSKPLKNENVKSSIFLPVVINGKTVAAFGIGFSQKNVLTKEYQQILLSFAYYVILSILSSKNISKAYSMLSETEEEFLESIVLMMEARDVYTKGHSQRVAYYAKNIAKVLGLGEKEQNDIYLAGIVHDIGKIGIPDNVLLKPGKLTSNEFKIMQYHPVFSYQIVKNIKQFKGDIALYVKYHHERCDGSGYSDGLKCKDIPIGARILAIADVFDAVTSSRPYRSRLLLDEALNILKEPSNKLDLDIVEKSLDVLSEVFIEEYDEECYFMPKEIDLIRKQFFTTDYVTGLMNRKQFIELVDSMIRKKEVFNLFLVDIVDLDYINYKYSMSTGDKVLSYIAKTLSNMKNVEYPSRMGSDSFVFVSKDYKDCDKDSLKDKIKSKLINSLEQDDECKKKQFNPDLIDFYITCTMFDKNSNNDAEGLIYECRLEKKKACRLLYADK